MWIINKFSSFSFAPRCKNLTIIWNDSQSLQRCMLIGMGYGNLTTKCHFVSHLLSIYSHCWSRTGLLRKRKTVQYSASETTTHCITIKTPHSVLLQTEWRACSESSPNWNSKSLFDITTYFHFPPRRFFVVVIWGFFFLHLMFITHGLIVVDSNSTRVYSCVQSLVMVSYA